MRVALAVALACDIAAYVARTNVAAMDVAIAATFAAACVLVVDVATARASSAAVGVPGAEATRDDGTWPDARR